MWHTAVSICSCVEATCKATAYLAVYSSTALIQAKWPTTSGLETLENFTRSYPPRLPGTSLSEPQHVPLDEKCRAVTVNTCDSTSHDAEPKPSTSRVPPPSPQARIPPVRHRESETSLTAPDQADADQVYPSVHRVRATDTEATIPEEENGGRRYRVRRTLLPCHGNS